MWQSIMGHTVVVHQITMKRCEVLARVAILEANFVVDSCVVYQCIKLAEFADRLLDSLETTFFCSKIC